MKKKIYSVFFKITSEHIYHEFVSVNIVEVVSLDVGSGGRGGRGVRPPGENQ